MQTVNGASWTFSIPEPLIEILALEHLDLLQHRHHILEEKDLPFRHPCWTIEQDLTKVNSMGFVKVFLVSENVIKSGK